MRSRRPSGAWRPADRELGCSRVFFTESTGRCIDSPVDVTRSPTCCPESPLYCSPQPERAPDGREPFRCSDCPRPMVSRLSPRTSGSSTSPAGTTTCGPIQKVRSRPTDGRARFAPSKPRVTFVAGSGTKDYASIPAGLNTSAARHTGGSPCSCSSRQPPGPQARRWPVPVARAGGTRRQPPSG